MGYLLCQADARRIPLADGSVHCAITSPPYFGLRDYGIDGQIGLEVAPGEFVAAMVAVFREVWRVLRDDGTAWINLGDSFARNGGEPGGGNRKLPHLEGIQSRMCSIPNGSGIKPKDMIGIPWRVAFALQADGWWLRDAITWAKAEVDDDDRLEGSAMPGSQRDRCTSASDMIFLLAKSARYYFDAEGCKTKSGAVLRNVWRMNPEPTRIKHFATFPRELPRRAIRLGTSEKGCCPRCGAPWRRVVERRRLLDGQSLVEGGWAQDQAGRIGANGISHSRVTIESKTLGWQPTCSHGLDPAPCIVLDPFAGSGTTLQVADGLGRHGIGFDLSREYLGLAARRLSRPHAPVARAGRDESLPLFGDLA